MTLRSAFVVWLLFTLTLVAVVPAEASQRPVPNLPTYWHQTAPRDCPEDALCWIGSRQDGRSDKQSMADWRYQIHQTAKAHR